VTTRTDEGEIRQRRVTRRSNPIVVSSPRYLYHLCFFFFFSSSFLLLLLLLFLLLFYFHASPITTVTFPYTSMDTEGREGEGAEINVAFSAPYLVKIEAEGEKDGFIRNPRMMFSGSGRLSDADKSTSPSLRYLAVRTVRW
jgi:hypothetical protein